MPPALLLTLVLSPVETHWAYRPLARPAPPMSGHAVDAFVADRLRREGLTAAPEADRRTLARRVYVDLHGLPPTPDELAAFLADGRPDAFGRLVDRLLASPRFGEREARRWLDVARYADSHGHDQDRPRPHAWPYRDYLIRAFNDDTPYPRFVREQVAGDALPSAGARAIEAAGFLAAGPWDESGLRDIREDSVDRLAAQNLERDEVATAVLSAFAGTTVGCARCHDHKFDPVSQADYYALQAVFAGVDKAEREYDPDPAVAARRAALLAALAKPGADGPWRAVAPSWQAAHGSAYRPLPDGSLLAGGARPERETTTLTLPLGRVEALTGVRVEALADPSLPAGGPGRQDNGNLHLSEVRLSLLRAGKAERVPLRAAAADFEQAGWLAAHALDGNPATAWGVFPEVGKSHRISFALAAPLSAGPGDALVLELDQVHGGGHLIGRIRVSLTSGEPLPGERARRELAALPAPSRVYAGTNRFAPDGTFRPAERPRVVRVLKRGEVTKPLAEATPGTFPLPGLPSRFSLPPDAPEGARRVALADWLTHPKNPLTWRVAANRVWQAHFGRGLVDTPSDFGAMGGTPSHPELLDWLACELRDTGSPKRLHRLIVTSAAYRRAATHDPAAVAKDADNRLNWRGQRRRLDAETLRDGLLQASGRLDLTMFGPPVRHFLTKPGVHVTPDTDYPAFDPDAPGANRRAVYRFVQRTKPDPLLETLDCPDPSASAPVRGESVGAAQALSMWNNRFVLRQCEHLAALAERSADKPEGRVALVCRRLLLREPTADEAREWAAHAQAHGLASLCRVLANSSEFVFAD